MAYRCAMRVKWEWSRGFGEVQNCKSFVAEQSLADERLPQLRRANLMKIRENKGK